MIRCPRTLLFVLAMALSSPTLAVEYFEVTHHTTTVRGRPELLRWTPESVTVIDARQLNETSRDYLSDLEGMAPGLIIDPLSGEPGAAAISMRGVGSADTTPGFFPAIAVNVDGVYMGGPDSQNQSLFDVDRVEIDRGPQGVWQGPPAPGGAINLFRSRPTGKFSVNTDITVGAFKRKHIDTVINFPLAAHLAGKLSYNWRRGNKRMIENIYTGRGENEQQTNAGSLSLLWRSSHANVQYTYDNDSDKSQVPALLNLSSLSDLVCVNSTNFVNCSENALGLVPETGSYNLTSQGFSNARRFKANQHALHVDFGLKKFHVTSITAVRKTDDYWNQDADATFANFYSTTDHLKYRQVSQEFDAWRAYGDNVTFSFGGFFMNSKYTWVHSDLYVLNAIANAGLIVPVAANARRTINARENRRVRSIYGDISFRLDPKWMADFGLRGNIVRTSRTDVSSNPSPASGTSTVAPSIFGGATEDRLATGSAGFSYKVDDNDMIYIRYSHAFRPRGFDNTATSVYSARHYGAERVSDYEIGLKSRWFDNHVRFSYVGYREDYKKKLERYAAVVASGRVESVLRNTSYIRTIGHEFEIEAVPIDNLLLRASLSHNNSDYIDYKIPDLTGANPYVDLQDTIPGRTPPDQYRLSALYTFPYWQGNINLYFAYRFTTTYWSNPHVASGHISTFAIMDFSIDYTWKDWTLRLFSRNFNDRRYLTNAVRTTASQVASLDPGTTADQPLMTTTTYDQPRFSGIELSYKVGASR